MGRLIGNLAAQSFRVEDITLSEFPSEMSTVGHLESPQQTLTMVV